MINNNLEKNTNSIIALQTFSIIIALTISIALLFINRNFYHDDAYITLRYAYNFIQGNGIVWNPEEYVQGYTNFFFLLCISFLGMFGVDLVWASHLVNFSAYFGLIIITALYGIILKDKNQALFWHIPVILVITSSPILIWILGGLETVLFSFLTLLASLCFLLALESQKSSKLLGISGVIFALSYLTRPDGIVFLVISASYLYLLAFKPIPKKSKLSLLQHPINNGRTQKNNLNKTDLIAFSIGAACILAPYTLWQINYYGDIVPNTFYAKSGAPISLKIQNGYSYIANYLTTPPYLPIIILCSLYYIKNNIKTILSSQFVYLTLMSLGYLAFILFVAGGDHMQSFRMIAPIIPILGLILTQILKTQKITTFNSILFFTSAAIFISCLQTTNTKLNPKQPDPAAEKGKIVGKFINKTWPKNSLIALSTAGSTPYYAISNRYIDMLGLNDATIGKRKIEKITLYWQKIPGHLKGDGNYTLSRKPDYIILGPATGTVSNQPWFLSDLELNNNPQFHKEYQALGFFMDKNSNPVAVKKGENWKAKGYFAFRYYKRKTP